MDEQLGSRYDVAIVGAGKAGLVGESLAQLKYSLRFHWKTAGRENKGLEDCCKCFIRMISNLATFQLDRNLFMDFINNIKLRGLKFDPKQMRGMAAV